MYMLRRLGEDYDNMFSTITQKIPSKKVIVDNVKDLFLSHMNRIKRIIKIVQISSLPSVNMSVKNGNDSA